MSAGGRLEVLAPDGLPEVRPGADLAALVADAVELRDGDVVVLTSKVVSKAEGRVREGEREDAIAEETERVVARRGATTIVRTRLGLTMAAAGVDASNVERGRIVLLPLDPDASARALRAGLRARTGRRVGVVVTDTAGRAWREGQTDIAVGAAGLRVAEVFAGRVDAHGNELAVTLPAVADEIAGAAELAQGKLGARPLAIVRGRADLVLPADDDGPGATALVRPPAGDLFGYGAREAVLRALSSALGPGADADDAGFGAVADADELLAGLERVGVEAVRAADGGVTCAAGPDAGAVVRAVAHAHRWRLGHDPDGRLQLRPRTP
ncbi:coenzyme F420-0:L-glutamate ligase [Nocardioides sp. TRM66260-LWL]|uniref:coenzyme F420-0:L-glutamate ligase n=1 Tax=Nocardioides sp. TRM66260-LWL TaxID=2874478 RepID=UPI001CC5CAF1|nr:coenzyme F420-0:L-glutamate ligase [Nocardioides sp. TRM66260-LWL]MBZ5734216.1 coenzyme F420-0:L-glutamate ligase [Nocardioides sp. TRM66260-LWL]